MADPAPASGGTILLPNENATSRLAEDIAAVLKRGDLVALSGGLGVGKTSLARALIRTVAGDPTLEVSSPTFPIRIDYTLPRLPLVHADLYRLQGADELEEIGLGEMLGEAALLVEWPEALPEGMEADRLDIALSLAHEGRAARIAGDGTWPERLARTQAIRAFLDRSGYGGAARRPLAGDASSRAYERIAAADGATAILMNAPRRAPGPPSYGGRSYDDLAHRALDVLPFMAIDLGLREAGLRAPEIRAADPETGLLLLEDLGSDGILDSAGLPIAERYEAAVDVLVGMHGRAWPENMPLPGGGAYRVPPYDRDALLVEISLFPDWFGGHGGEPAFPKEAREGFLDAWSEVLDTVDPNARTWVMRDFHSPNILWDGQAEGIHRVGIIDFQDTLIGHPAYDLASLAQDARAHVTAAQEQRLRKRYLAGRRAQDPAFDADTFDAAYTILAAQRATKVLGAFTRLALAEGKPGYQRHRERLKALLRRNLAHPVLSALRVWYEPYI